MFVFFLDLHETHKRQPGRDLVHIIKILCFSVHEITKLFKAFMTQFFVLF